MTTPDTRTRQAGALIDDARCLFADMAEDGVTSNHLDAARCSLNVALAHISMLEKDLAAWSA